jgi:hypothetical protein
MWHLPDREAMTLIGGPLPPTVAPLEAQKGQQLMEDLEIDQRDDQQ